MTTSAALSSEAVTTEQPRLLFFYSKTSGQCRRVEAFLSQVLQRRHNHQTFRLVRVCTERHAELVDHFHVDSVPTIVVVEHRRVKARVTAPRGRKELEEALAPWLR